MTQKNNIDSQSKTFLISCNSLTILLPRDDIPDLRSAEIGWDGMQGLKPRTPLSLMPHNQVYIFILMEVYAIHI